MNLRLTPFNILVASLLVHTLFLALNKQQQVVSKHGGITIVVVAVLVIIDLMLRRWLPSVKQIWMIELIGIVLITLMLLLVRL